MAHGSLAFDIHGFTDAATMQRAAKSAELYYVNDQMTWLARQIGEGLPLCAFDVDDLPAPAGLLVWSDDPRPRGEATSTSPRAVFWCRAGLSLRVLLLDDAGFNRRLLEEHRDKAGTMEYLFLESMIIGAVSANCAVPVPLNTETPWEQLPGSWKPSGAGQPQDVDEDDRRETENDALQVIRTLLGTLLLIRQPADARRGLRQAEDVRPDSAARKRLRRMNAERPDATVRYVTLRQSIRPAPEDDRGAQDTASRVYRHQWFVRPHRRTYPDRNDPTGRSRRWVGPYLVTPAGCENAPILGRERVVNVLRR
ncbi:hypothetical protein ADK54_09815 [Streptomyces sp. WM6378]|nr:hypothetical protein ADK54_09815 [Streptomyces sp. WM6378]